MLFSGILESKAKVAPDLRKVWKPKPNKGRSISFNIVAKRFLRRDWVRREPSMKTNNGAEGGRETKLRSVVTD